MDKKKSLIILRLMGSFSKFADLLNVNDSAWTQHRPRKLTNFIRLYNFFQFQYTVAISALNLLNIRNTLSNSTDNRLLKQIF